MIPATISSLGRLGGTCWPDPRRQWLRPQAYISGKTLEPRPSAETGFAGQNRTGLFAVKEKTRHDANLLQGGPWSREAAGGKPFFGLETEPPGRQTSGTLIHSAGYWSAAPPKGTAELRGGEARLAQGHTPNARGTPHQRFNKETDVGHPGRNPALPGPGCWCGKRENLGRSEPRLQEGR